MGSAAVFATVAGAVWSAGSAAADEPVAASDGVEIVESALGGQTSDAVAHADGDSSMVVVEHGTVVDVPSDPSDGLVIDTAGTGIEITMVPLDDTLGEFDVDGADPIAVAEGDGYETIAQPLDDGNFRLAVTIETVDGPHSFAYAMELPQGTLAVKRADGGYDFLDPTGDVVGGLGAPWGLDAFGQPVEVSYDLVNGVLTRTVAVSSADAYPVLTNWCLFGKNPNGSCRGSRIVKQVLYDFAWYTVGTLFCVPVTVVTTPAGGVVCAASLYALKTAVDSRRKS